MTARREAPGSFMLGDTPVMRSLETMLRRVADLDSTLLIGGESGAGKEVAARFTHGISRRAKVPFMAVNCAAIPDTLIESEIFGHDRGAFTGAETAHAGNLERAGEGTLFLDEIGDLSLATQTRLLRVVEERAFTRLGSTRPIPLRARLMCATFVDLPKAIAAGRFRQDLYYRLAVIPVTVPPLRARRGDIVTLLRRFTAEFAQAFARDVKGIGAEAERDACCYGWPGNVRELRNRVERAVALSDGPWLTSAALFPDAAGPLAPADERPGRLPPLSKVVAEAERRHIEKALAECCGHIEQAARLLGVSRSTLFEKLRRQRA